MEKKILTAALKASGHYVDMAAFRLYVTPAFEKKASYYGTPECDIMNAILDAFPNMAVEVVKPERKNNAITYDMMEKYITIMPDAANNMAEFKRIKKVSHAYRSAYQYVADWFATKFPHYGEMLVKDEKTGKVTWNVLEQYKMAQEEAAKATESEAAAKPVEDAAEHNNITKLPAFA